MMILLTLLTAAVYHSLLCALTNPVDHSELSVRLKKVDDFVERNHVWFVQQQRPFRRRRYASFLQLGQQTLTRSAGILLHDQVLASRKLATYFADIGIGTDPVSTFRVLFDTGSCEFWVPDESCFTKQCRGHRKYVRSSTFEPRFNEDGSASQMSVQYLSGSLKGYDAYDTVHLGSDISVPHTSIGFATHLDIPLLQDLEWDGIVGLGFKNREISERGVLPFIDHIAASGSLIKKNLANQFAYYLSADGGALTFGGADLSRKENPAEEFSWVAVDPSNSYWTVHVLSVVKTGRLAFYSTRTSDFSAKRRDVYGRLGSHQVSAAGGASIVDTGTYLIYAPTRAMDHYLSDLHVSSCDDKQSLPDLSFQFEGVPKNGAPTVVELQLSPDDYVLEFVNDDGVHECMLGIAADDSEAEDGLKGWTFGQVLLRGYYTVFDRDHLAVGFVRAKH